MYEPDEENLVENSTTKDSSQNIGKLDRKMNTQSSIKEQKSQLEECERFQKGEEAGQADRKPASLTASCTSSKR